MLYSYIRIAIRNFSRRTLYHAINIVGLSVGLAVVGMVVLYVVHEKTYDSFHTQSQQIVRFSSKRGDTWFGTFSPIHSRFLLDNNLPEVEKTVRLRRYPPKYITLGNEKIYESKVLLTDVGSNFFDLFDFPLLHGNKTLALQKDKSAVLTESVAKKLFGDRNALGETIIFDTLHLTVTAVVSDLPSNTHMDFSVLICNNQAMEAASAHFTYGLLAGGANTENIKTKLMAVPSPANKFSFLQDCKITPLQDLHYEANMTFEMKSPGNKTYLLIFASIATMILILSCFNFINLSIAIFTQRAKEIAVRKVLGANRRGVFVQLLLESVLISIICFPIALAILEVLIPSFNDFMGIQMDNLILQNIYWIAGSFVATIGIGLLSGIYPAWILPRINSIILFRKGLPKSVGNIKTRSALVGFQMVVMVIMLSGSWIINDQLKFIQEKDLGFDRQGVFTLEGAGMVDSLQFAILKTRLLSHHAISHVSHGLVPGDEDYGMPYQLQGSEAISNDLIAFPVGKEYMATLGIKVLKTDYDQSSELLPNRVVLVNETFAKQIGGDCIGQRIVMNPGKDYEATRVINGVFKDFNFFSLHQPMTPMMITFKNASTSPNENIVIRVNPKNTAEAVPFIEKTVRETIETIPLTLRPLNESLALQYDKEQKLLFFSRVLLGITVLLSMLGFIGLSSYTTELRTKEIGIRKILGASTSSLILTLSEFFIKIIFIAFTLGSFLSFFMFENWLSTYAYQTTITVIPFAATLLGLGFILIVTVGWHSLKTANTNPVNSLRSE